MAKVYPIDEEHHHVGYGSRGQFLRYPTDRRSKLRTYSVVGCQKPKYSKDVEDIHVLSA